MTSVSAPLRAGRARRIALAVAAGFALAGPAVLAFFSGGYFKPALLWAAIAAWALVLLAALAAPRPLPRTRGAAAALAGLVALAAWTAASFGWAPLKGVVETDIERILLYLGALLAAAALLRGRAAALSEPALALGALIVIGYGLAGRLLPGIVHLHASGAAGGRLEQPLTYWNGEGALAAVGFVLCARLTGEPRRAHAVRLAAAAATVPLGMGVYLSYSRGAIAAAIAGLVVLVAAVPTRTQARAVALALAAGALGALAGGAFGGVASLSGTPAARERDGAIVLVLLIALAAAAAWVARRGARDEPLVTSRRLAPIAVTLVALIVAGQTVAALGERANRPAFGARASRLTALGSNREDYWRVAARAFVHHPLDGLGSGGFRVAWLRERTISEGALDAHSLELQTAAELGLPGLAALLFVLGGIAIAARDAQRRRPLLAAGPIAGLTVWLVHSEIDWDWQLPALTLVAVALAGVLLAAAEAPVPD